MTDKHEHDLRPDVETDEFEELTDDPMDAALGVATDSARDGRLALASGGVLLLGALRSLARGQWRTLPTAAIGAALVGVGLRQQRANEPTTFEPSTDEIEGETEGKETTDEAGAAAERPDAGQESQIDASGDVDASADLGEADDEGSRIEFTDDEEAEPRSKPNADKEDEDPRRTTDDEETEVDVSDTAMAEEAAEATGPDPEQAQPTQTDSTEPEETPEEDASDMKVEPDEDDDSEDDN